MALTVVSIAGLICALYMAGMYFMILKLASLLVGSLTG
jgi:hypothetical protein